MERLAQLSDKQVIVAGIQTHGRGQFDRKWISDKPGNVYMSIVLINTHLKNYTFQMAEALCSVLRQDYELNPTIKEPNDVMVDSKKIAGILSQSATRGDKLNGIVLGIGVNLSLTEHDLSLIDQPATSLNLIIGKSIDRNTFINRLLDEFFVNYPSFID